MGRASTAVSLREQFTASGWPPCRKGRSSEAVRRGRRWLGPCCGLRARDWVREVSPSHAQLPPPPSSDLPSLPTLTYSRSLPLPPMQSCLTSSRPLATVRRRSRPRRQARPLCLPETSPPYSQAGDSLLGRSQGGWSSGAAASWGVGRSGGHATAVQVRQVALSVEWGTLVSWHIA